MEDNNNKNFVHAIKDMSELAREIIRNSNSEKITENDAISTSEYMSGLNDVLNSIDKEIQGCDSSEAKSDLYKQREDVLNRMREEKENQRAYQLNREQNERNYNKYILGVVGVAVLGAGGKMIKGLLEDKKS